MTEPLSASSGQNSSLRCRGCPGSRGRGTPARFSTVKIDLQQFMGRTDPHVVTVGQGRRIHAAHLIESTADLKRDALTHDTQVGSEKPSHMLGCAKMDEIG